MQLLKVAFALALGVSTLEVAPLNRSVQAPVTNRTAVRPDGKAVQALRGKLEKMAAGLQAMLGPMGATQIGPELKTFVTELRSVLNETKGMTDNEAALKKLMSARAGVAQLTQDLTKRQVNIMKDEEAQKDSLLLGVLMTRQKEPMAEQLKLLSSDDFATLPVSQALLAKHNDSVPLFGQAAAYLDAHVAKGIKIKERSEADRKAAQKATAARLQKSVDSLQKSYDARVKHNAQREQELQADVKKATTKKSKHVLEAIKKREERIFKKWAVMQKHDIEAMKEAVVAVEKGDFTALNKAQAALKQSMESLKSKNAGFLVLLSLGHELMERDCPYCAAQCVDACHTAGKPYVQCLGDCADAGKGK